MCDTNDRHDNMLFCMLKECKTLPNFLDEVFGFLQRRTDFYVTAYESNAAVGLPEGLAEKLVRQTFYKWKPQPTEVVYDDTAIPTATEEIVWTNEELDEVTSTSDKDKPDEKFSISEYYNGAAHDNYCWSQTILEVNVVVLVPDNVTIKDLKVHNDHRSISVKLKDGTCLLEGDLHAQCTQSIWSFEGGKLEIHLNKVSDIWWNRLLKSEPEFDLSRIDCTRPYEDLSEEAQAKIQELQWNQEQKRLGLPTSEELILQEKLRKGWNAEGSPFSGPFDPSIVSFR